VISLVAYGADNNNTGAASSFVGIPQPIGIANGDIVLVGIVVSVANVTITPPSSDWQLVTQTDPTQALSVSVWWTTALNLPTNLVFVLSASCQAEGALLAYRGTDPFLPVEAAATALTASSSNHTVPAITASQSSEEVALFIAGAFGGAYSPAANFIEVVPPANRQTNCALSAQHKGLQAAGVLAATTETFSAAAIGASAIVVLAPNAGTVSYDDAYRRIFDALPQGIDNVLDFTPGQGDFYWYFWVIGAVLKTYAFDLFDLARAEAIAFTSRFKLPDWERIFGLAQTATALLGTIPQRQAQVLGAWRFAAGQGSPASVVQAILGPILGYNPTTLAQVVECDRSMLRLLHTYGFGVDVSLPNSSTQTILIPVVDGGKVSRMGAQLELPFATPPPSGFTITLTAPDGNSASWSSPAAGWSTAVKLYAPSLAGAVVRGSWTLSITNNSGSSNTLYGGPILFVEGIGPKQDTGGAIFHWGVYADPVHLGESGNPADFNAAQLAVQKLTFSHCVGNLIVALGAAPGSANAIPGRFCPA
jgi:hypothetical protein